MAQFLDRPVPNADAADWIAGKPLVSKTVFENLLPELRARVFTVSGLTSAEALRSVRDTLAELPLGGDWDALKTQIIAQLHPFLRDPDEPENTRAARRRAELLLRTQGFQAYAVAQHNALAEQADIFTHRQYLSMGDDRVRPAHAALNGVILPADSPFWDTHTPPWDWGCRCRLAPLMPEEVEEIADSEANLPPEDQQVLQGAARAKLERENRLNRNVRDPETGQLLRDGIQGVSTTPPIDKNPATGYRFSPQSLRWTETDLKARTDPPVWAEFAAWAAKAVITDLSTTVLAWLRGETR